MKRAVFQCIDHPEDTAAIIGTIEIAARSAKDGTEDVPGETIADNALRRDTVRTILQSEKQLAPDCKSPKVADTKNVEKPSNGNWAERWVIDRCGTQVAYGVTYRSDPKGGTNIAIERP